MEKVEQWCTALCIICITTGVLIHIVPDGKIKKGVNIAYSLLFLTTVVSIFNGIDSFDIDIDIDYSENIIKSYNYDLNSYITDMANIKIEEEIGKSLDSICKNDYSVDLNWVNIDNTYQLTEITITVTYEDMKNAELIKSTIGSLTGIIPEVKNHDKNQ